MTFYTYILASKRNGTLYTGSTDDLARRVGEHRGKILSGFTARYGVCTLVWYEEHPTREAAFRRERRIKKWERDWKKALIERFNPGWRDLLGVFTGCTSDPAAEAERFLAELDQQNRKNLGPRLRGDEREGGGDEPDPPETSGDVPDPAAADEPPPSPSAHPREGGDPGFFSSGPHA